MLLLLAALLASPLPASKPTVAMMPLVARQGVTGDSAELLSDHVLVALRAAGCFSRVVAISELQSALAFDAQKQAANCTSESCFAEIAGSLGVDFMVTGNVGRLGDTWLFSLKLIELKVGVARGAVSTPFEGQSEAVLVDSAASVVGEMLRSAGLLSGAVPGTQVQPRAAVPPAPEVAPPQQRQAVGPHVDAGAGAGWTPVRKILTGAGVAGWVAAGVAALVAVGGGAASLAALAFISVPDAGRYRTPTRTVLLGGMGVAGLGGMAVFLLGVVGAVCLLASWVQR